MYLKKNREPGQQTENDLQQQWKPKEPRSRSKGRVRMPLPNAKEERSGREMPSVLILCRRPTSTSPVDWTAPMTGLRTRNHTVNKRTVRRQVYRTWRSSVRTRRKLNKTGRSMRGAAVGTRSAGEEAPITCPRNTQQPSSVRAGVSTEHQLHMRGGEGVGWGANRTPATRASTNNGRIGSQVCMSTTGGGQGSENERRERKRAVPRRPGGGPRNATACGRGGSRQRESRSTGCSVEWRRERGKSDATRKLGG